MDLKRVVAIFDIGKTNKKLFLFDERYRIVYERSARFAETVDEDGEACENLEGLRLSVFDSLCEVFRQKEFDIRAVNFSTYGASLVHIGQDGNPLTPLYSYLKSYPDDIKKQFYDAYGGEEKFSHQTASPVLGSLNSGMQLYRIKQERPSLFGKIRHSLHLPQYLSYLITGKVFSDITSIGCHTNLWDFQGNDYHYWVKQEGIWEKLAPVSAADMTVPSAFPGNGYEVGIGLHDSSAALIPYLANFNEPFILLSTGTWCIAMNPFNHSQLSKEELTNDCLCYMQYQGKPVKSSRLFAGFEHEQQTMRIADYFNQDIEAYQSIEFDSSIIQGLRKKIDSSYEPQNFGGKLKESGFSKRDMTEFSSYPEAYHQLILDMIRQQVSAINMVIDNTSVRRIFVDGGFSRNSIYMHLLASEFPGMEIFAASMAQATAMGTALVIHRSWNTGPVPSDIIELKHYSDK